MPSLNRLYHIQKNRIDALLESIQLCLYRFGGSIVAQRDGSGPLTYLHGDHLGSISVLTDATGTLASRQEFYSWGSVRACGAAGTNVQLYRPALRPLTVSFQETGLLTGLNTEGANANKLYLGGPGDTQGLNRYSDVLQKPGYYSLAELYKFDPGLESTVIQYFTKR